MGIEITTIVIFGAFFVLLLIGMPVAFCLFSIAILGYLLFAGPHTLFLTVPVIFRSVTLDIYVALPLFIFMASVFQVSGIGERMYTAMYKWFGGLRGGLAIGTIFMCTIIAAITGLAGTGTILLGMLAYPEMRKRGYDKSLAIGSILAGGVLGPIIPPSCPMILIGGLTGVSVGKLFMAGVFTGLLCAALFVAYIGLRSLYNPSLAPALPKEQRSSWSDKFGSLRGVIAPILLIIAVLGGIYAGIFTPSEAGGVGAFGALICMALYKNLNMRMLTTAVSQTAKTAAMIMWIIMGGYLFSSLLNTTGVTQFLGGFISGVSASPNVVLFVMLAILFVQGMFMDLAPIVFISLPIMWVASINLGFNPLWFAFIFIFDCIIGMLTPPFGISLFYFKGLGHKDVGMENIYKAALPFVPIMIIVLILCILFPEIVLWLPNTMIR